jgi:hypothetical protein
MSRRVPPSSPLSGVRVHTPLSSPDPFADVLCVRLRNDEVDITSATSDRTRFRLLLGHLAARFAEFPELLNEIAGVKP